jgi:hypothetical protein
MTDTTPRGRFLLPHHQEVTPMAEQLRRTMTFRLDADTRTMIRLIAALEKRSASRVVREAVEAHVARMTGEGSGGELQGGR